MSKNSVSFRTEKYNAEKYAILQIRKRNSFKQSQNLLAYTSGEDCFFRRFKTVYEV